MAEIYRRKRLALGSRLLRPKKLTLCHALMGEYTLRFGLLVSNLVGKLSTHLVPPLDDLPDAYRELEGPPAIPRGVELLPVGR